VNILGAGPNDRFSPELQDRLADILLHEAGLAAYRAGRITRHDVMNNLDRLWAGLPNSSGRSHYHGYAGNAATMSWSHFENEMTRILQG
jgi:muramidase (phage lysozyme)